MKLPLTIIMIIASINNLFSQSKPNKKDDLFQRFDRYDKEAAKKAKYDFFQIRYDEDLKPYIEVSYLNESDKTITTFSSYYDYTLNDKQFRSKKIIHQIIKPHQTRKFIVKISDEQLAYYHKPTDFSMQKFVFNNIRYSDGSLKDVFIMLP